MRVNAEITSVIDIGPYLDAVVGTMRLFKLPRVEALLHCLRAVEAVETAGAAVIGQPPDALYQRMRRAQDLLRYLIYEIFDRCPGSGEIRESSQYELQLATATVDEFAKLARLRDGVESVRRKLADARVDMERRVVTFINPPETLRHVLLEQEKVDRVLSPDDSAGLDPTPPPDLLARLFSSVRLDALARSFSYELSEDVVAEAILWADDRWRSTLSDPLPEDWSFGPYTVREFRKFCQLLATWTNLHSLLYCGVARELLIPHSSAVPTPSVDDILEFMRRHGSLPLQVSSEIVRDLTYNPHEVEWTDVQYQPLIPLVGGQIALPPLVISGSNFERNLLAIVEKLPWRKAAASRVKSSREQVMIEEILRESTRARISSRARLELHDGGRTVGDVDLLLWDRTGHAALAVQLKWLYGPDSIHETWVHGERYREGGEKHLRTVAFLRDELPRIVTDYALEGLVSTAEVLPVLVTKDDEPMRQSLPLGLPAVPQRDFERLLRACDGDVRTLHQAVDEHWNRKPELRCVERRDRVCFGAYVFEIPVAICPAPDMA